MARPLRIERAGSWYHVTSRGNGRTRIYLDDTDRIHFIELLAELVARFRWRLHGYALMDNHYHLQIETTEPNLSRGMQWLQVSYSMWFNRRRRLVGHLFQGRFKAVVVEPDQWGVHLSQYVHLNPVRVAKLGLGKAERSRNRRVSEPKADPELRRARLEVLRSYRWSSYRAHAGMEATPPWLESEWLLKRMGKGTSAERRRRYRREVEALVDGLESPWENLVGGLLLGNAEWAERFKGSLVGDACEQTSVRKLKSRPDWSRVVTEVEREKGEKWEKFRDEYGDWGRDLALVLGKRECGLKLRELGELCGGIDYRTVGTAATKLLRSMDRDPKLRQRYERVRMRVLRSPVSG